MVAGGDRISGSALSTRGAHTDNPRDRSYTGRSRRPGEESGDFLFAIALAAGVRRDSVPDVLQDAFVRAFRALPRLEEYGSYGSWFLAIVRNVARRSLREALRRDAASPDLDRLADRTRENHVDTLERSDFSGRTSRPTAGRRRPPRRTRPGEYPARLGAPAHPRSKPSHGQSRSQQHRSFA